MEHKNEVHLAGVLARDPELRYTPTGKVVANFTITTTYEKHTEYHRCMAWEKVAEQLGEHFKKGSFIALCGRLQTRSWEDKNTKQKKYATEVIAWNVNDGSKQKPAHAELRTQSPACPENTTKHPRSGDH
jgi:single stranded DNA-binding protein